MARKPKQLPQEQSPVPENQSDEAIEQEIDNEENDFAIEGDQEQPKNPDSGIKMKVVLGQINHSGKVYKLGDVITLTGDDAQRLINLGVTEKV